MNESRCQVYSTKVFLGGLPPDVDEGELQQQFKLFGPVKVDWPRKGTTAYLFPPKGFAFLFFANEESVHRLIEGCWDNGGKLHFPVSSPSVKARLVEVRPWKISESITVLDNRFLHTKQYAAFVGGISRRMTSRELALVLANMYGGLTYASINLDPKNQYPNGSALVLFSDYQSYASAMKQNFAYINFSSKEFLVEFRPFIKSAYFWNSWKVGASKIDKDLCGCVQSPSTSIHNHNSNS